MRFVRTILIAFSIVGLQAESKLSPELVGIAPESRVDVIVQYQKPPTRAHEARVVARGGEFKRGLEIIHAAHYSVAAKQLEALSRDPDVEFVSPDHPVFSTAVYTGKPDYGWRTVGADLATSVFGADGSGIGIAMIDSGVNDKDDLKDALGHNRIVYKASFLAGLSQDDHYGHGTHVSGVLAGNGYKSTSSQSSYQVRGIAPKAKLISLKALNDTGVGSDSAVI